MQFFSLVQPGHLFTKYLPGNYRDFFLHPSASARLRVFFLQMGGGVDIRILTWGSFIRHELVVITLIVPLIIRHRYIKLCLLIGLRYICFKPSYSQGGRTSCLSHIKLGGIVRVDFPGPSLVRDVPLSPG